MFKITAFGEAVVFILLGTFIAYHRTTLKINTVKLVLQTSLICMLTFVAIGFFHSLFVIIFIFTEDVELKNVATYSNLSSKESTSHILALIF